MRRLLLALCVAGVAGACTTPGTGWSRAPDLSVYGAMDTYGEIAREQSILCGGFSPGVVAEAWDEDFGMREMAVSTALLSRYGARATSAAADAQPPRVPCEGVPTLKWRHRYERLLRLLEARFGLA